MREELCWSSGRFNGATLFQRGKLWDNCPYMFAGLKLQWGHAFSAWKTSVQFPKAPATCCFNGATLFQRGKLEKSNFLGAHE